MAVAIVIGACLLFLGLAGFLVYQWGRHMNSAETHREMERLRLERESLQCRNCGLYYEDPDGATLCANYDWLRGRGKNLPD